MTPEREQHLLRVIEIWKARAKTARQQAFKEAAEIAHNFAPKGPRGVVSVTALQIEKYILALAEKKEGES